jgi:HEPN domain-containing protein
VTNLDLARSYLRKATDRLAVLELLQSRRAYSDVVREAQELVELCLKGMLRAIGVDPPKFHEVSALLLEHRDRLPVDVSPNVERLALISKRLRKERELAFYGDIDFIPTEEYSEADASAAFSDAEFVVDQARRTLPA